MVSLDISYSPKTPQEHVSQEIEMVSYLTKVPSLCTVLRMSIWLGCCDRSGRKLACQETKLCFDRLAVRNLVQLNRHKLGTRFSQDPLRSLSKWADTPTEYHHLFQEEEEKLI
jgi:hypothetical protein